MLVNKIIAEGSLRLAQGRLAVDIRLPWYRSLPLSTVEIDSIAIDGAELPPEALTFRVNGADRALSELGALTDENWFVIDPATLLMEGVETNAGATHEVDLCISLYPPYIGHRRAFRWQKTMEVSAS